MGVVRSLFGYGIEQPQFSATQPHCTSVQPSFHTTMAFESGTAYAESDADDEVSDFAPRELFLCDSAVYGAKTGDFQYERSVVNLASDSEATESESPSSNEHTPTTYGNHSSSDRLPETIVTEWDATECSEFVAGIGLRQYADCFLGMLAAPAAHLPILTPTRK